MTIQTANRISLALIVGIIVLVMLSIFALMAAASLCCPDGGFCP